jgi:amino acid adenylation domain-containing protein
MSAAETLTTVDRRVAEVGARHAERLAVAGARHELSYRELTSRAARVRAGLERLGVRPGSTVGVCLNRGADLIATVLGVLSAGAAYLPLDGGYPLARLDFMVRDAGATCVVGGAPAGLSVPAVAVSDLEGDREITSIRPTAAEPDGIAYVIYTSGSTGRPKGVEVTHRNLTAFLDAMITLLPPAAGRLVLFSTRFSFDIAGLEVFLPLTTGGTCLVAPETHVLNVRSLVALVNRARPSLVQATPVGWRLLLDGGARFSAGQSLLCGGDILPLGLAGRLAEQPAASVNLYGPTEASVWATAWPIVPGATRIGRPLSHARVYVLDDKLNPVAEGVEGEAYLGGPAVAAGYRGRPGLTAERFVPDPWSNLPGGRMYATGDIVRRSGGELEFLRRRDTQVKINGYRVELGEIESVAEGVDGVRAAVAVVVGADPGADLQLYLESAEDAPTVAAAVRARLAESLPAAMLPRQVDVVPELPVTANGKVDRAALAHGASLDMR